MPYPLEPKKKKQKGKNTLGRRWEPRTRFILIQFMHLHNRGILREAILISFSSQNIGVLHSRFWPDMSSRDKDRLVWRILNCCLSLCCLNRRQVWSALMAAFAWITKITKNTFLLIWMIPIIDLITYQAQLPVCCFLYYVIKNGNNPSSTRYQFHVPTTLMLLP